MITLSSIITQWALQETTPSLIMKDKFNNTDLPTPLKAIREKKSTLTNKTIEIMNTKIVIAMTKDHIPNITKTTPIQIIAKDTIADRRDGDSS